MSKITGGVTMQQSKFVWEIENFERKARYYPEIRSPIFTTIVDDMEMRRRTKWEITMTFYEIDENGEEYIGIHLDCINNCFAEIDLEFAILDNCNKEVYESGLVDAMYDKITLSKFIKKDELLKVHRSTLISNDKLTIICTITTNKYIDVEDCKFKDHAEQLLRLEESDNFLKLFNGGLLSDVVFTVEGKEILAHKSIVANRSPVFEAMFRQDMREARDNIVEVKDVPFNTMFDLLKFIYSGKVPSYTRHDSYEMYKNLMAAANKYGIENLENECERRLLGCLTVDNVFDSLNLADIHDAQRLKKSAIDFIVSHGNEIIDSPAYKEFGKLHPEISCEVFRALVIKKRRYD